MDLGEITIAELDKEYHEVMVKGRAEISATIAALQELGQVYARLQYLRDLLGTVTPEFVLEEAASKIADRARLGYPRFCQGDGNPHIWLDRPRGAPFEKFCESHQSMETK